MHSLKPQNEENSKQYRVSFKCLDEYRFSFRNSTCSVTISVGQAVHEGSKFLYTLKAINKSFQTCNIMLADTLQRHTLAIQHDTHAEDLHDYSRLMGSQWLERNIKFLNTLSIEYSISRWDEWLFHPDFDSTKAMILVHYQNNDEFKCAMDDTIDEFVNRMLSRDNAINYEKALEHSFNYLIEECAIQILWTSKDYHFEIYPSQRNKVLETCYNHFIQPTHSNLLRPVSLKFKSNKTTFNDEEILS